MPTLTPSWRLDGLELLDPAYLRQQIDHPLLNGYANQFVRTVNRQPSYGYVLISRANLARIEQRAPIRHPVHQLKISDGERSTTINKLAIVRSQSLTPTNHNNRDSHDPNEAILLTLVDTRYYAAWSCIYKSYNRRDADNQIHDIQTWASMLNNIWKLGVPRLMGSLLYRGRLPSWKPEDYRFDGVPGWEAILHICEQFQWIIAPTSSNSNYVLHTYTPTPSLSENEKRAYDAAVSSYMLDREAPYHRLVLPEKICVFAHNRDYQYWQSPAPDPTTQQETPPDQWVTDPINGEEFSTLAHRPNNLAIRTDAILPGTADTLWLDFPIVIDDHNRFSNEKEFRAAARERVQNHVASLYYAHNFGGHTFSGVWPFTLNPIFNRIAYWDYGDGLRTRVFTRPVDSYDHHSPDPRTPYDRSPIPITTPREYPGRPDLARIHTPYHRSAYAKLLPSAPLDEQGGCRVLLPGQKTTAIILRALVSDDGREQAWFPSGRVEAFNATDKPYVFIKADVSDDITTFHPDAKLEYHYQAGRQGEWEIVSHSHWNNHKGTILDAPKPPECNDDPPRKLTIPVRLDCERRTVNVVLLFPEGCVIAVEKGDEIIFALAEDGCYYAVSDYSKPLKCCEEFEFDVLNGDPVILPSGKISIPRVKLRQTKDGCLIPVNGKPIDEDGKPIDDEDDLELDICDAELKCSATSGENTDCGSCGVSANQFTFTPSGITDGTCGGSDCVNLNTLTTITSDGAAGCYWTGGTAIVCGTTNSAWEFIYRGAGVWALTYDGNGVTISDYQNPTQMEVEYTVTDSTWDCQSNLTLTKTGNGDETLCNNWPASITIAPV